MSTSRIFLALLLVVALSGFVFTECMATDIIVQGGNGGPGGDNLSGTPGGGNGVGGFVDSGGHGGTPDTGTGGNGYAHSGTMGSIYGGLGGGFGLGGGGGGLSSGGSSSNINGRDSTPDYGNGGGGGGATLDITNNVNDPSANIEVLGGSGGSCAGITYCGGSGGGGGAMLIMGGNALVNTITVRAGSGGDDNAPGTRGGGGGGGAMLDIAGDVAAQTVTVTSGSDGRGSSGTGRRGGAASFTADTLKAQNIDLTKHDGGLTFEVDTLGVNPGSSGNKVLNLNLDGTVAGVTGVAGGVTIHTLELGSGETFNVNVDPVRGGDFTLKELDVLGKDATYNGDLTPVNEIKFYLDMSSLAKNDTMLTVSDNANLNLVTIDFTGTPTLQMNDQIYLLKSSALLSGWTSTLGTQLTHMQYTFDLTGRGDDLILVVVGVPPQGGGGVVQPVVMHVSSNNDNDNNNNVGGLSTGSGLCSSPIIISISADPILEGARLSVETWSGDECTLFYQWQVEQNGVWINIPGATGPDYYYTGLSAGTYTVRCIVKNAAGEMISTPVTFTVS